MDLGLQYDYFCFHHVNLAPPASGYWQDTRLRFSPTIPFYLFIYLLCFLSFDAPDFQTKNNFKTNESSMDSSETHPE